MNQQHKINTAKEVIYASIGHTSGLTDLVLEVLKPDGTAFTGSPFSLAEQGSTGKYEVSYTPDTLGVWEERFVSPTNGDKLDRAYKVIDTDLEDVQDSIDQVETKIDNLSITIPTGGYPAY